MKISFIESHCIVCHGSCYHVPNWENKTYSGFVAYDISQETENTRKVAENKLSLSSIENPLYLKFTPHPQDELDFTKGLAWTFLIITMIGWFLLVYFMKEN